MSGRAIAAAIFDMDGTLLDSEVIYGAAFQDARAALGLPPDEAAFHAVVGLPTPAMRPTLTAALGPRTDAFLAAWDAALAPAFDRPVPVKPGAVDVLAALAARGVPLAVATSTRTGPARDRLAKAGLDHRFAHVVGGDAVERGKPAPDIYLRAAALLGADPAACAAFEDSEVGTRAALAAGCRVVQVPDVVPPTKDFAASGQVVAATLLDGARALGLIGGPA
ncbi:HAD family phosphatase [Jannaschia sp. LMIT008]|uniref:HAD family hydrolase n=1 Tax=Jannaschia maritima TaxID=3032585 RepID=UPI002810E013|nr:HAD family phosphatase [Jannaschia sp. LMIT008]